MVLIVTVQTVTWKWHYDIRYSFFTADNSREEVAKTEGQIDRPNIPPGIVYEDHERFTRQTVQT